jgi:hypothetical protein
LGIHGFGPAALDQVETALHGAGHELTPDPYGQYECAREGKLARDANLADFFLCTGCASRWQAEAFDDTEPVFVGEQSGGYCLNCNEDRADVRLRQWILCGNCERVARSIGRSVVAERYVLDYWRTVLFPGTADLVIESTDPPTLRRGPRGAPGAKRAEIDFLVRRKEGGPVFGIEMKTGKSHISGVAQAGSRMGEFQLDVSDCDDIATVMTRDKLPVYLLHVQVIDRIHPPTLRYVPLSAWWTDPFRMGEYSIGFSAGPAKRETRPTSALGCLRSSRRSRATSDPGNKKL